MTIPTQMLHTVVMSADEGKYGERGTHSKREERVGVGDDWSVTLLGQACSNDILPLGHASTSVDG